MGNEHEKITELTPEQMDGVSGGFISYAGGVVGAGDDGLVKNNYNTGDTPGVTGSAVRCSVSPDGKHNWIYYKNRTLRRCSYCNMSEKV